MWGIEIRRDDTSSSHATLDFFVAEGEPGTHFIPFKYYGLPEKGFAQEKYIGRISYQGAGGLILHTAYAPKHVIISGSYTPKQVIIPGLVVMDKHIHAIAASEVRRKFSKGNVVYKSMTEKERWTLERMGWEEDRVYTVFEFRIKSWMKAFYDCNSKRNFDALKLLQKL